MILLLKNCRIFQSRPGNITRKTIATVEFESLDESHQLASIPREENSAIFTLKEVSLHFIKGLGAGRWPAIESIIGDLLFATQTKDTIRCKVPA